MAQKAFVSIPADVPPISATLGAAGASTVIYFGTNVVFEINADADMFIAFGVSTVGYPAATATSFRIPANVPYRWDTGNLNDSIQLYSTVGGHYWIQRVTYLDK